MTQLTTETKTKSLATQTDESAIAKAKKDAKRSKAQKIFKAIYTNISVEPVLFLYGLGFAISQNISPVLYMDKICQVGSPLFGHLIGNGTVNTWDELTCDHMDSGDFKDVQQYVQKTFQIMSYVMLFVKGIPPVIFTLFVGPWSDRFGRKLLIVLPMTGYIFYNIWFLINVIYFHSMVPEWLMLEVLTYLPGGFFCLFLGAYSYAADHSCTKYRTLRIGIIDFIFFSGLALGTGISGKVYEYGGYMTIYSVGLLCHVAAMLYGILAIKEKKKPDESGDANAMKAAESGLTSLTKPEKPTMSLKAVFSLEHVKNSFSVVFKKREDGSRHFIILLVLIFGMYTYANTGTILINLPYTKNVFKWSGEVEFNNWWAVYFSVTQLCQAFGIGAVMPILTQFFKLNDLVITTICVISFMLGMITTSVAPTAQFLYVAAGCQVFASLATTSIRAALSKVVSCKDVGKIFASVGCTQALIGMLNPTYNLMYQLTLDWFPQFCYALSCVILLVMLFMLAYCIWFWKKLLRKQEEAEKRSKDGSTDDEGKDAFDAQVFEFAKRVRSVSIWSASEISIKL